MCCTRLTENTGRTNSPSAHYSTNLSGHIFATKAHISTIGKKSFTQQYLLHMSSQYVQFRPTCGWDLLASLQHPSKFQLVSRLGGVTALHFGIRRQPSFASLNRGRHLYSAGQPSRLTLAHIMAIFLFYFLHRYFDVPGPIFAKLCHTTRYVLK